MATTKSSVRSTLSGSRRVSVLSAAIALFCLPNVGQDTIKYEDIKFREYLESKGWDTTQLCLLKDDEVVASAGEESHSPTETKI